MNTLERHFANMTPEQQDAETHRLAAQAVRLLFPDTSSWEDDYRVAWWACSFDLWGGTNYGHTEEQRRALWFANRAHHGVHEAYCYRDIAEMVLAQEAA